MVFRPRVRGCYAALDLAMIIVVLVDLELARVKLGVLDCLEVTRIPDIFDPV